MEQIRLNLLCYFCRHYHFSNDDTNSLQDLQLVLVLLFSQWALLQNLYLSIFSVISYVAVTWHALLCAGLGTGQSDGLCCHLSCF